MIMYHLGPQLGVWIMQVSTFPRVLINRFHSNGQLTGDINLQVHSTIDKFVYQSMQI